MSAGYRHGFDPKDEGNAIEFPNLGVFAGFDSFTTVLLFSVVLAS
jgi:hypothetical protein